MKSILATALVVAVVTSGAILVPTLGLADDGAKPGPAKPAPVDEAKAKAAKEAARVRATQAAALKVKVGDWLDARKGVVGNCPRCAGSGTVYVTRGRVISRETCRACEGVGKIISPKRWQKVKYDVLSPAKRLTLKLEDVMASLKTTDAKGPDTGYIKAWRIDHVELVGDHLGRAFVFEGKDTVARESRWIEAADPVTKVVGWFLYSEDTDGAWEDTTPDAAVSGDPVPKIETLTVDELDALRAKIGLAKGHQGLESAQKAEGAVVVQVFDAAAKSAQELDAHFSDDVVPVTRAVFQAIPDADAARVVFLARWRDKFGAVQKKPYRTTEIRREDFDRIRFENLSKEEVLALFSMKETMQEGEVMWWKADKEPEGGEPGK